MPPVAAALVHIDNPGEFFVRMAFASLVCLSLGCSALAGVTNPKISIIGRPDLSWTDDGEDSSRNRLVLDPGETEIVFDDYLNPYARGYFTLAVGEEGLELEEGYFTIFRGLPFGLNLKGGKYRLGFGKLNMLHEHTYPFAERFRVLAEYLPGEESFNEAALQLSHRLPSPGESSITASVDWLQGDSFRIEPDDPAAELVDEPRPGVLGRVSSFWPIGERSGLEFGVSATHGTNNVAAGSRTSLFGADLKLKLWNGDRSYLLLQGELLQLRRDDATWSAGSASYDRDQVEPVGFYVYADYNWSLRWNAGVSFESFQEAALDPLSHQAFGAYAGFALMEETTVFRLAYEHFAPEVGDSVNSLNLRVVFSLGPHKAHQF